jgi:hypothetical protein
MNEIIELKNCLHNFKNYKEIEKRYPKIKSWIISSGKYEDRLKKLSNSNIYKSITEHAKSFILKHNEKEILSWIDSLDLINKIFQNDNLNQELKDSAVIIQEYVLPYTKNNRPDFLIIKNNKILILEFTFQNSIFIDKAQQCFTYKQILEQFLPKNIECISYIFSYTNETKEDNENLNNQVNTCISFINHFFETTQAYNELAKLKEYI